MTILEAITQADLIRPNQLDPAVKLRWLSTLDGQIWTELLRGTPEAPERFRGYDGDTELQGTRLLVPYPYDELYPLYLLMRIDLEHGETARGNNDAAIKGGTIVSGKNVSVSADSAGISHSSETSGFSSSSRWEADVAGDSTSSGCSS